eukprot:214104_1
MIAAVDKMLWRSSSSSCGDSSDPAPGVCPSGDSARLSQCRPWDSDDFRERVRTFTIPRWFGKSPSISGLECARYGWICVDTNMLECGVCKTRLFYKASPDLSRDTISGIDHSFRVRIESAHARVCAWRANSSPLEFTRIPTHASLLVGACAGRAQLWEKARTLPIIGRACLEKITELIGDNNVDSMSNALILACCGWSRCTLKSGSIEKDFAQCTMCNRNIGLWNYQQISIDVASSSPGELSQSSSSLKRNAPEDPNLGQSAKRRRPNIPKSALYSDVFLTPSSRMCNSIFCTSLAEPAMSCTSMFGRAPHDNSEDMSHLEWGCESKTSEESYAPCGSRSNTVEIYSGGREAEAPSTRKRRLYFPNPEDGSHRNSRVVRQRLAGNSLPMMSGPSISVTRKRRADFAAEAPSTKRLKDTLKLFDPIFEHRHLCPWLNPVDPSCESMGSAVGWEYCLRAIQTLEFSNGNPVNGEQAISAVQRLLRSVSLESHTRNV